MKRIANEMALLYNFTNGDQTRKVRSALLCMGVRSKLVEADDYFQPIGVVLGQAERLEEGVGADFTEEMLVLYRFSSRRIDELLTRLRRVGAKPIPYKALVTDSNIHWSGAQLIEELKQEHEAVQQGKSVHSQEAEA